MRKILTLLAILTVWASASALDFSWMDGAPEKYVAANTRLVNSPEAPCNKGAEAFKTFIQRFRTDAKFRKSRLKFEADDEIAPMAIDCCDMSLIKPANTTEDGVRTIANWYKISANEVRFHFDEYPTDPDSEWGGSNLAARFQRINGKWYCTGFMVAG